MNRIIAALLISTGLASAALAQSPQVPGTQFSVAIPNSGAIVSRTTLIAGKTGQGIYVTAALIVPAAGSVLRFEYGTGTNCSVGTTDVTGILTFAAGNVVEYGSGNGAVWVIPPGNSLCITITTAVAPGTIAYAQF